MYESIVKTLIEFLLNNINEGFNLIIYKITLRLYLTLQYCDGIW